MRCFIFIKPKSALVFTIFLSVGLLWRYGYSVNKFHVKKLSYAKNNFPSLETKTKPLITSTTAITTNKKRFLEKISVEKNAETYNLAQEQNPELNTEAKKTQTNIFSNESRITKENNYARPIKKKTVVLILTNKRSGSSFLGELFNRNPEVFYLFEPLYPYTRYCNVLEKERVEALSQFVRCDFTNARNLYLDAFKVTRHTDAFSNCIKNNVCFMDWKHYLLSNYQRECLKTLINIECHKVPLYLDVLSRLCQNSKLVVFKVIRICDFSTMMSLLESDVVKKVIDLKVIHLIRDPRAILSSRLKMPDDELSIETLAREAQIVCRRLRTNSLFSDAYWGQGDSPPVSYLRVRYEDMVRDPHGVAREMYDYVGTPLPSNVIQWINKSVIKSDDNLTIPSFAHSLKRRTSDVLNGWRRTLAFKRVISVQRHCNDVMKRHNYVTVNSEDELRNEEKDLW